MPDLAQVHIAGQDRLRALLAAAVTGVWQELPGHDRENIDEWLTRVLPLVAGAQLQTVAFTEAYLARALGRPPIGVDRDELTGAAVRAGTAPEDVYTRPFVTVWTALKAGREFDQALAAGLARATGATATDVQISMRATAAAVSRADPRIRGFERVTDGNACQLCRLAASQRYGRGDLLPIHPHCGCTVRPLVDPEIDLERQPVLTAADGLTAEIRQHGELGPVLVDAAHNFDVL